VREQANEALAKDIRRLFETNEQRYGSPRIVLDLREEGKSCSKNRVARLMRSKGLVARAKRRFKATTRSKKNQRCSPDLVQRRFAAESPNRLWSSDITYIWTREGWLYLAVILDVYSRMIVGWATSSRIDTDLVCTAVTRAIYTRRPDPGVILHSDRGSQYASNEVLMLAQQHSIQLSMGGTGSCYDNAIKETFFHTLKTECVHFESYDTRNNGHNSLFEYIELYYNRRRRHSGVGYRTPVQVEQENINT
jgi:transposase InsO family protein